MILLSENIASCLSTKSKYFTYLYYKMKMDSIVDRKETEKYRYKNIEQNKTHLEHVSGGLTIYYLSFNRF